MLLACVTTALSLCYISGQKRFKKRFRISNCNRWCNCWAQTYLSLLSDNFLICLGFLTGSKLKKSREFKKIITFVEKLKSVFSRANFTLFLIWHGLTSYLTRRPLIFLFTEIIKNCTIAKQKLFLIFIAYEFYG